MALSKRFLLITWDGAGNLPPARSIARTLIARGHTVHAIAHASACPTLARDGIHCTAVRDVAPYDTLHAMDPAEEMPFVVEQIWWARAFGTELLAAVERVRPDALLIDVNLTYALVAAQRTGLPTTAICHFPYQLALGPFAGLTAAKLDATNAYAIELGLPPFASHQALVEASLVLVACYRAFDEVEAPGPNVVHVGPMRTPEGAAGAWRRTTDRPLVLVGLSTSNQNQADLLQRLCDALGTLDVEAVVTTGPAIAPASLRPAANTTVVEFIAHEEILPAAELLITHAGHGTIMAGVTYGVPMLCFPLGRDQPLNAYRVAGLGLGSVAQPEASVAEITQAVSTLLADTTTRQRARAFAESLRGHAGLDRAIELIEGR